MHAPVFITGDIAFFKNGFQWGLENSKINYTKIKKKKKTESYNVSKWLVWQHFESRIPYPLN